MNIRLRTVPFYFFVWEVHHQLVMRGQFHLFNSRYRPVITGQTADLFVLPRLTSAPLCLLPHEFRSITVEPSSGKLRKQGFPDFGAFLSICFRTFVFSVDLILCLNNRGRTAKLK